ncbi:hypothetical protein BN946_scf184798.g89 [Trametes cinnabarina]|uniref:Large ribosomal subunit protein mL49 n=1 Tax=Pycnoporus cinnabarinus TaxID=5643 RepID=A0A060SET1_PYCCI|nr:hypothetical protein BN946_scf184798.g89 [Trametes cinnabarina]
MLRSLVPRLFAPARHNQARLFSAQPASSPATRAPSEPLQPSTSTSETLSQGQSENVDPSKPLRPYHVPRNSRGSIPVYSQIRNHTKYFILLRDVQGNVEVRISRALRLSSCADLHPPSRACLPICLDTPPAPLTPATHILTRPPATSPAALPRHLHPTRLVQALMHDLQTSLFPQGSEEAARLKISLDRRQRIVLSGGRWKNQVVEWLVQRGF